MLCSHCVTLKEKGADGSIVAFSPACFDLFFLRAKSDEDKWKTKNTEKFSMWGNGTHRNSSFWPPLRLVFYSFLFLYFSGEYTFPRKIPLTFVRDYERRELDVDEKRVSFFTLLEYRMSQFFFLIYSSERRNGNKVKFLY